MQIVILATPEIEPALRRLGVSALVKTFPIEAMLALSMSEQSQEQSASLAGSVRGLPVGIVVGDIDDAVLGKIEKVAAGLLPAFSTVSAVHRYIPGADTELIEWVVDRLAGLAASNAIEAGRAALQLGAMRRTLETSEAALRRLEKHAADFGAPVLVRQVPHGGSFVPLEGRREQIINAGRGGVHGFDLMLRHRQRLSDSAVQVRLERPGTGEVLAEWRLREAQLRQGWNRFDCPATAETTGGPLLVAVSAEPDSRCEIGLTGRALPPPAEDDPHNDAALTRPFAIRVWGGIAGVELRRSGVGHVATGTMRADGGPRTVLVPFSEVLPLAVSLHAENARSISWRTEENDLQVHPRGPVPSFAIIRSIPARSLRSVIAHVMLAHAAAQPADFAIWAGLAGDLPPPIPGPERHLQRGSWRLPGLRQAKKSEIGTAPAATAPEWQWLPLTAGESGEIEFRFSEPVTGDVDIVLATRNPGHDNRYSWAVFRALLAEVEVEQMSGAQ